MPGRLIRILCNTLTCLLMANRSDPAWPISMVMTILLVSVEVWANMLIRLPAIGLNDFG